MSGLVDTVDIVVSPGKPGGKLRQVRIPLGPAAPVNNRSALDLKDAGISKPRTVSHGSQGALNYDSKDREYRPTESQTKSRNIFSKHPKPIIVKLPADGDKISGSLSMIFSWDGSESGAAVCDASLVQSQQGEETLIEICIQLRIPDNPGAQFSEICLLVHFSTTGVLGFNRDKITLRKEQYSCVQLNGNYNIDPEIWEFEGTRKQPYQVLRWLLESKELENNKAYVFRYIIPRSLPLLTHINLECQCTFLRGPMKQSRPTEEEIRAGKRYMTYQLERGADVKSRHLPSSKFK